MIQLFCAYTGLLNAGSFFVIALFIFIRGKNKIHLTFSLWALFVGWWSLGYFLWLFSKSNNEALFWARFLMAGCVFIPPSFLHFVLAYLNLSHIKRFLTQIQWAYGVAAFLFLCVFTPLLVNRVEARYWFQWWPVPGWAYHIFLASFLIVVLYAHVLFYQAIQRLYGVQRKQLITVTVGTTIAFAGGSTNHFLWYNIPVPPVFNLLVFVHVIVMFYAIMNYGLWNIRLVFRRTLVFSGLFATAMMVLGVVTVVTQGVLSRYVPFPRTLSTALAFAIGIVIYTPVQKFLGRITYRFLYQGSSDNLRLILRQLSEELTHFIDVHELGQRVLDPFQKQMPLEAGALIVKARGSQDYETAAVFGLAPEAALFESTDPLIQHFKTPNGILNLQNVLQAQQIPGDITASLERRKGAVAIALKSHGALNGLLILGRKKSDKEFEAYEIDMLAALGSEIAVAIRNTQLLEEIFQEREQKLKAQAQADLVAYAKTIAHEIKNAAAGIRSYGERIRDSEIPKLWKVLSDSEELKRKGEPILQEMTESVQTMDQFVERIRVIAKTAEGTLSSNEGTREDIYFKLLWNEALRAAEVRDASLEVVIPENFIIRGNLVHLERVFVNLLTNSKEAMESINASVTPALEPGSIDWMPGQARHDNNRTPDEPSKRPTKTIRLKAEEREVDSAKVAWFEYSDSGPGIPENLIKRIFEQGFSTKRPGAPAPAFASGHGYGLWVCKKTIEEIHKGKIWVERQPQGGSKFIFWLPL